jgi:hypothetical protein
VQRFPFELAVSTPGLLKEAFDDLSFPQQVTLKAFYGCQLDPKKVNPKTGFSELDYWAIIQGSCTYDDLGNVVDITPVPYKPKEYEQLWAVIGRRAGKTSQLMAFIVAYEATLGGHEEYIQKNQDCAIYLIAHRLGLAVASMPFVRNIINSSPRLAKEVVAGTAADVIELKNGIKIMASNPSIKAQRGFAVPVAAMDEVGFWYSDPESANPDVEVERAVSYSQLQFPHSKRIGISTPWTKEGLLWKYFMAGTEGNKLRPEADKEEFDGVLVCFGTTASYENPRLSQKKLRRLKNADAEAFERESMCRFLDSVSGFFAYGLLMQAVSKAPNIEERPPAAKDGKIHPQYVAAMDPAFRTDSFAFVIGHRNTEKGFVVDVTRRWTPVRGQKLNPKEVLSEIKQLVDAYNVDTVYSDQYQLESLQQLALDMGMNINGVDFTSKSKAKLYGNVQQLVNQGKLELLDPATSVPNAELFNEMRIIERRNMGSGAVQIAAPEGRHDDMVSALVLAAHAASWTEATVDVEEAVWQEPTVYERCIQTLKKQHVTSDW